MAHRWPWRPGLAGAFTAGLGAGCQHLGWSDPALVLEGAGGVAFTGSTGWWWARHVVRPHSTRSAMTRRSELDQRCGGVATWLDVVEHAGTRALRRKTTVLRPSTRNLTRQDRRRIDPRELGVEVVRLGWGLPGQRIWSSCEDATLRISPPRAGKTVSLACHGIDAPGALITTSTRLDLAEMVHTARTAAGPVHFFNPAGFGGLSSTVRWRVLAGCEDFGTAQRRAADLIPEGRGGEGERWDAQARRILALLLHAGAVSGARMSDVLRWITELSTTSLEEITGGLTQAPGAGRERAAALRSFFGLYDRGRDSVILTMATPLAWLNDDQARLLGDCAADDPDLIDLPALIEGRGTLHLIGHESNTAMSPLIAALVSEIAHTARTLAATRPGGRLDPPLTMVLDEAALVCPVPLDRWTADMGGRGVTIHISVQSLSQLRQRWGLDGAGTILANVSAFLVLGGSPSADDLRDISTLTGEYRMRVIGADHDNDTDSDGERRGEHRWVPVLSPAQIRALEPGQALLLRRGLHTVIGYTPSVVNRRGWAPVTLTPQPTPPVRVGALTRVVAGARAAAAVTTRATRALVTAFVRPTPITEHADVDVVIDLTTPTNPTTPTSTGGTGHGQEEGR